MTAVGNNRPARHFWIGDAAVALGLLAAIPNLLMTAFLGAWISVPAHRAIPDHGLPPVYDAWDVALHYAPFWLILLLAVCTVIARMRGRRIWAIGLAVLQLLAFAAVVVPTMQL